MDLIEEWKPIPGFEGLYEASNLGRIKSVERVTIGTDGVKKPVKETILTPKSSTNQQRGDYRVELRKDAVYHTCLVSRLVAMAWTPFPFDKLTVNHINGNFLDNRAENLEWVTLAENIRHGFRTGLYDRNKRPVSLTNSDTGKEFKFESMSAASRFLGHGIGYVSNCIKKGIGCYDDYGIEFYPKPLSTAEYLGVKCDDGSTEALRQVQAQ